MWQYIMPRMVILTITAIVDMILAYKFQILSLTTAGLGLSWSIETLIQIRRDERHREEMNQRMTMKDMLD